jgi:uncharacterized protein YqiB (DUF1249 family)
MRARNIRLYHLAQALRTSDSAVCERLQGRYPLAPHERARISECLGMSEEWLFAPLDVPVSARRETAMLQPLAETR